LGESELKEVKETNPNLSQLQKEAIFDGPNEKQYIVLNSVVWCIR